MKKKIFVVILPFLLFFLCLSVSRLYLTGIHAIHFHCPFRVLWGIYCPGCGCTRALSALLRFDIPGSLRNNPSIIIMCAFLTMWYLQTLFRCFGINKKMIPESKVFYLILSGIMIIFFVARNFIPFLQPS